ncbi:Zinc finger protein SNAI2 [Halotydeus destructor]|nr:Zinc finger protein SNAI2 [Halotydeus destructor]
MCWGSADLTSASFIAETAQFDDSSQGNLIIDETNYECSDIPNESGENVPTARRKYVDSAAVEDLKKEDLYSNDLLFHGEDNPGRQIHGGGTDALFAATTSSASSFSKTDEAISNCCHVDRMERSQGKESQKGYFVTLAEPVKASSCSDRRGVLEPACTSSPRSVVTSIISSDENVVSHVTSQGGTQDSSLLQSENTSYSSRDIHLLSPASLVTESAHRSSTSRSQNILMDDANVEGRNSTTCEPITNQTVCESDLPYDEIPFHRRCSKCQVLFHAEASYHIHRPCFQAENSNTSIRSDSINGKRFKCSKCTMAFVQIDGLRRHFRLHCPFAFSCKSCDFKSHRLHEMRRHLSVHTAGNVYRCHLCPKKFRKDTTYSEHMNHHNKVKPFMCHSPNCRSSFASKKALNAHFRRHKKKLIAKCRVCCERLPEDLDLEKHLCKIYPRRAIEQEIVPASNRTKESDIEVIDLISDSEETAPFPEITIPTQKPISSPEVITITPGILVSRAQSQQTKRFRIIVTGKSLKDQAESFEVISKKNTAISVEYRSIGSTENIELEQSADHTGRDISMTGSATTVCGLCRGVYANVSPFT